MKMSGIKAAAARQAAGVAVQVAAGVAVAVRASLVAADVPT